MAPTAEYHYEHTLQLQLGLTQGPQPAGTQQVLNLCTSSCGRHVRLSGLSPRQLAQGAGSVAVQAIPGTGAGDGRYSSAKHRAVG